MIWYAAGLVWILQIFFWGIGLALLAAPARWRRFWPAFFAPAGLALQSLVVWVGAHTRLPGTDSYALVSQVIPAGLLAAAFWRQRGRESAWRLVTGVWRWWAVAGLMVISFSFLAYPYTKPPALLTSAAIGSCDAADYAAGARVLKEFSKNDRSGFLGNTEIARSLSVDNFFDFWLRINHFSPSAVLALNSSLCGRQPYELTSLLGLVLLTLHLPGVFWLARSGFRLGQMGSLAVAAIYGFSPSLYYAVYQTALGQLMATPAVALLTWAAWQAFRGPKTWQRLTAWSALLLTGDWLLFGSYNFFILFAYIPVLGYAGARTLWTRDWRSAGRWALLIGANLTLCALLFPDRVMSVVERFALFNATHFGWAIPGFWPSGWYGAFADTALFPAQAVWASALAALALTATAVTVLQSVRRGRGHTDLLAACCALPILFGYWYLLREDRLRHDNSSYDAFKLFTVFYPGILCALCLWLRASRTAGPQRLLAAGLGAALLAVNVAGASKYNFAVRRTPLTVDPDLTAIAEVERMPEVDSVNITFERVWSRLWANHFLLHKKQYLNVPTYEGRPVTALRGGWDLAEHLVYVQSGDQINLLAGNHTYMLTRHQDTPPVQVRLGQGWNAVEHARGEMWVWGKEAPTIRVINSEPRARRATFGFSLHCASQRHLAIHTAEGVLWSGVIGPTLKAIDGVPLMLPPGTTLLEFQTPEAPDRPPGDIRAVTFCLGRFVVDLPENRPDPEAK